jgi:hypothetical protein
MISIKGLDKAAVLAALYNASRVQGIGFLAARPGDMTIDQARVELVSSSSIHGFMYFDYLHGRVMKVDLSKDEFDEGLYDRDLGKGAAWRALRRVGLL